MRGIGWLLGLASIIAALFTPSTAQLTWKLVHSGNSSTAPAPRRDAAIGYDGVRRQIILFGGRTMINNVLTVFDDTWIYNTVSNKWKKVDKPTRPSARFSFVAGVSGDNFYVSTGEGRSRVFFDDIWRFNLRTEEWQQLPTQSQPSYYNNQQWAFKSRSAVKPEVRYGAAGGIFPNSSRFYVTHGFATMRFSDAFSYSLPENGWFLESPNKDLYNPAYPHARCLHAGTMMSSDELLIMGGCLTGGHTGGPCPSADSWMFDGKAKTWTQLMGCASARNWATLATLPVKSGERRALLYGGVEKGKQVLATIESPANQVGVFNPDTKTWALRRAVGNIPSKRASAPMATTDVGIYMFGGFDLRGKMLNDLYLLEGNALTADQAPLQAECNPTFFNFIMLHGILMALGWGFFLPWGAFIARYFKHKDPLWFHLHRLFQIFGLLVALAGFVCAVLSVQFDHFKFSHGIIGLVIMILGLQQPINALLRPHKPADGERKTFRRAIWEVYHVVIGHSTILLALCNVTLGIFLALTTRIIWILWFAYLGLFVFIHIVAHLNRSYKGTSKTHRPSHSSEKYILRDKQNGSGAGHTYDNNALGVDG